MCKNSEKEFNIIKDDKIIYDTVEKSKENKIERYRVNKILEPIANYKVNEVKEIYIKLSLPMEKLTKQKMYDIIESLIKN
jgi:Glu-tRNA(Gln) amidotransferase subunit E-like FAD-binding protein